MQNRVFKTPVDVLMADVQSQLEQAKDPKTQKRLYAVKLTLSGMDSVKVGKLLGMGGSTVRDCARKADSEGAASLQYRHTGGPKPRLTDEQKESVRQAVLLPATDYGYDVWEGKTISSYITETFNVILSVRSCQRLMHELGFSYRKPGIRPCRNPDSEDREAFKKNWK